MERKERKFEFKHYEVLDKMSCVDGLEALRTYKPQSIESQPNLNIKIPKHRSAEGENMLQTWKSGWTFQKAVLKHFWFLAQNHCQNGSKSWRERYWWVRTDNLVFGLTTSLLALWERTTSFQPRFLDGCRMWTSHVRTPHLSQPWLWRSHDVREP